VKKDIPNEELSGPGLELEGSLNRLTAQAELAVQDSDPVESFLRRMSSRDLIDKNEPFDV
jgi:D-alanyl-D-alanine carboxypeptidase